MRLLRVALAALVVIALAPRAARADDEGEDVVEPLPWRVDADTVFLRRIVRAADGTPVQGAVVRLFCEVPHPEPGFGTPAATGTSGADGWVRIRKDQVDRKVADAYGEPTWAFVEATGLRPDAVMNEFLETKDDWELGPATTLRVRLVDPLDRPVAGALVGWLLGSDTRPTCGRLVPAPTASRCSSGSAAATGASGRSGRSPRDSRRTM